MATVWIGTTRGWNTSWAVEKKTICTAELVRDGRETQAWACHTLVRKTCAVCLGVRKTWFPFTALTYLNDPFNDRTRRAATCLSG